MLLVQHDVPFGWLPWHTARSREYQAVGFWEVSRSKKQTFLLVCVLAYI